MLEKVLPIGSILPTLWLVVAIPSSEGFPLGDAGNELRFCSIQLALSPQSTRGTCRGAGSLDNLEARKMNSQNFSHITE